jgi:paraquat-inducible protein B
VLLHGIQVGEVLDFQLRFDPERVDFSIPVLIEIEPERIAVDRKVDQVLAGNTDILKALIASGMRGQLKTGNLLTGQLYVDLDFHPDAPSAELTEQDGYRVLPTVPAPIEAITTKLRDVLAKVDAFPLAQIGSELTATLGTIREIVASPDLKLAVEDLEQTLTDLRSLAAQLDASIAPELTATLNQARLAVENINGLIGPDAPLNTEVIRTMRELSAAARSIRAFADYLDRHPEALIRGKGGMRQ